jgi:hypothetical protein
MSESERVTIEGGVVPIDEVKHAGWNNENVTTSLRRRK